MKEPGLDSRPREKTHPEAGRIRQKRGAVKEPGLDNRHRDKNPQDFGEIQQKRGDTLNKGLPRPIKEYSPNARLETIRRETVETNERGSFTNQSGHRRVHALRKGEALLEQAEYWLTTVEETRKSFEKSVYKNKSFGALDSLNHRSALFSRLAEADSLMLAIKKLPHDSPNEIISRVETVSNDLFKELLAWHMPADFLDPVPDSFKRGMQEAMNGEVVDFPGEKI